MTAGVLRNMLLALRSAGMAPLDTPAAADVRSNCPLTCR